MNSNDIKIENPVLYKVIENSISSGKISHAFLLNASFDQNVDNEARFIIGAIISQNVNEIVNPDSYSDYYFVDGSNGLKKNDVVSVIENLSTSALDSRGYRFLHIKNIENAFGDAAANSILKFIEEPPRKTYIVMTSNNPEEVLSTIKSRSQNINITPTDITVLNNLIKAKGISKNKSLIYAQLINNIDELENLDTTKVDSTIKIIAAGFKEGLIQKERLTSSLLSQIVKTNYKQFIFIMMIYVNDIWKAKVKTNLSFEKSKEVLMKYGLANFKVDKALIALNDMVSKINRNISFTLCVSNLFIELEKCYE